MLTSAKSEPNRIPENPQKPQSKYNEFLMSQKTIFPP